MKVDIVHDWLTNIGGAENVVLYFHDIYKDAKVYTSVYCPTNLSEKFNDIEVVPSSLQGNKEEIRNHKSFFPMMPGAFKNFELEKCDVVLTSSSSCAKMVKVPEGAIHIVYCHTPMRYAWSAYKEYVKSVSLLKRPLVRILLHWMRKQDLESNKHVDYFIANSNEVKNRIKQYYNRDSVVIHPGVDISRFTCTEDDDGYYLVVSRFVKYKRIDLAIEACNRLKKPLIIIGDGDESKNLKKIAGNTVTFIKGISQEEIAFYYSRCKAFLFPGEEDFGITPVEAMASGKPVIAFSRGGALDTVINKKTGLFFKNQTVECLCQAILEFETMEFDHQAIRKHAEQFDVPIFEQKIKDFVEKCYKENKKK